MEKAVITNLSTGVTREVLLNQVVRVNRAHYSTGYYANYFVPLLGEDNSSAFLNASTIQVEVSYGLVPGETLTELFLIRRVEPWQWVSPV